MTGPVFRNTWSTLRARETFGLGVEEVDEWEEGGVDDCEDLGEKGEDHQLESRVHEEGTYDVEFVADILKRWRCHFHNGETAAKSRTQRPEGEGVD